MARCSLYFRPTPPAAMRPNYPSDSDTRSVFHSSYSHQLFYVIVPGPADIGRCVASILYVSTNRNIVRSIPIVESAGIHSSMYVNGSRHLGRHVSDNGLATINTWLNHDGVTRHLLYMVSSRHWIWLTISTVHRGSRVYSFSGVSWKFSKPA